MFGTPCAWIWGDWRKHRFIETGDRNAHSATETNDDGLALGVHSHDRRRVPGDGCNIHLENFRRLRCMGQQWELGLDDWPGQRERLSRNRRQCRFQLHRERDDGGEPHDCRAFCSECQFNCDGHANHGFHPDREQRHGEWNFGLQ